ncbi:MAG: hypothetical protein C4346_07560 [Chloroflexota bacterium]
MNALLLVRFATSSRSGRFPRLVAAIGLLVALLPFTNAPTEAAGVASLTLHVSRCPAHYPGPDYFGACHERWFGGVSFTVQGPTSFSAITPRSGPEKGVISRGRLTPGTYVISERFPVGTIDFLVYCSLWNPDLRVPFSYTRSGIQITLNAGQAVLCDWFHVPAKARATTDLNLRAGPSTSHPVLAVIPRGRRVELTGQRDNGFLSVRFKGIDGWAFGQFLRQEATTVSPTTDLNLRAGPSALHDVITVMPAGTLVRVTGPRAGGFLAVRFRGLDGWAASRFLLAQDP